MGRRRSCAIFSAKISLSPTAPSLAPPRTVKSSPTTTTGRPPMRARPITKLDGVNSTNRPRLSYWPEPVSEPTSVKESGSVQALMRSRTVSLPAALWRATLSSPPIFAASAWRYAISSTSGCQLMSLPPMHKVKHNSCHFVSG